MARRVSRVAHFRLGVLRELEQRDGGSHGEGGLVEAGPPAEVAGDAGAGKDGGVGDPVPFFGELFLGGGGLTGV